MVNQYILLPETDNCPSWIRGRENVFHDQISMKECCRPGRVRTCNLLITSQTHIKLRHPGRLIAIPNQISTISMHRKFGENLLRFTQVIVLKPKGRCVVGRQLYQKLMKFAYYQSVTRSPKYQCTYQVWWKSTQVIVLKRKYGLVAGR